MKFIIETISLLTISLAFFDFAICGVCPVSTPTVRSVSRCPASKVEWDEAARRKKCEMMADTKNCDMPPVYHCLLNQWRNETLEVCASPWYISGFCAIYDTNGMKVGDDFSRDCTNFTEGKCLSRYHSPEAYKYQKCYEKILDSSLSQTNPAQQTSEDSGNTIFIILIVLLCFIIVALAVALGKNSKRLRKILKIDCRYCPCFGDIEIATPETDNLLKTETSNEDSSQVSGNNLNRTTEQEKTGSVETPNKDSSQGYGNNLNQTTEQEKTESVATINEHTSPNTGKNIRKEQSQDDDTNSGDTPGPRTHSKRETRQQNTEGFCVDGVDVSPLPGVPNAKDVFEKNAIKVGIPSPTFDSETETTQQKIEDDCRNKVGDSESGFTNAEKSIFGDTEKQDVPKKETRLDDETRNEDKIDSYQSENLEELSDTRQNKNGNDSDQNESSDEILEIVQPSDGAGKSDTWSNPVSKQEEPSAELSERVEDSDTGSNPVSKQEGNGNKFGKKNDKTLVEKRCALFERQS